jgi:hypothetical protein
VASQEGLSAVELAEKLCFQGDSLLIFILLFRVLHHVGVGSVADVSEVHTSPIFRFEASTHFSVGTGELNQHQPRTTVKAEDR